MTFFKLERLKFTKKKLAQYKTRQISGLKHSFIISKIDIKLFRFYSATYNNSQIKQLNFIKRVIKIVFRKIPNLPCFKYFNILVFRQEQEMKKQLDSNLKVINERLSEINEKKKRD